VWPSGWGRVTRVKSYSTTQPLAAKYSYIVYSVNDSSDTSFAYRNDTEAINKQTEQTTDTTLIHASE